MKIGIIGLGYVGLPLAQVFAKKHEVVGYDINKERIHQLQQGYDHTHELTEQQLMEVLQQRPGLQLTDRLNDLTDCNYYIITVPTPVDEQQKPDLSLLIQASQAVAGLLKKNDIVIYESTVYPGATEEVCVPQLEKYSSLTFNTDFFVGYSPERINPADKKHTVEKILKVTSGSNDRTAQLVDQLYASIIQAGTYLAPSIKVAEAAKVIENAQRDINIAFVNELAKIFNLLEIDTSEVLKAAQTKWNFLPFHPGLVGGHCIGVDPYYLAQKALEVGYHPEIILAGRRLNDSMGTYISSELIKLMLKNDKQIQGARVLVLGITFKENCPDVRNTRVIDIIRDLQEYGVHIDLVDPVASATQVKKEFDLDLKSQIDSYQYDAVVAAVAHDQFKTIEIERFQQQGALVYDVKGVFKGAADKSL